MIFRHVLLILCFIHPVMIFVQGQLELCAGISCNGRGSCEPNSEYTRGYWCQCEEGWTGQDCLHPEPSVSCGDDRITVTIDKSLIQELGIDDEARNVYFGRSAGGLQCRATDVDHSYQLTIRAPFSACGTQVIQQASGDDYTFSNTVVWSNRQGGSENLINREMILLDFKCIYEDTYSTIGAPIPPDMNVLHLITERGEFEIRMRLFDDESFSSAHEFTENPDISIGIMVYVQVELEYVADHHLVVTLDRCFASQSGAPDDPISTKHTLIAGRCVNPNDSTVEILSNGESSISRFRFQMFKWRWSSDDVYLHCEVDICNKTNDICVGEQDSCKGSKHFRKRRNVVIKEGIYDPSFAPHADRIISQGPIYVEIEELKIGGARFDDEDTEVDTSVLVLGLILGLVFLLLGMAGGVYVRRSQKNRKIRAKREAAKKRLTSLKPRTESF